MKTGTPVRIPIRLEQWDDDDIETVKTVTVDARTILDATAYDELPAPEDRDADTIALEAQAIGRLEPWGGPFTVLLDESDEYPAYLEWRRTHRNVEGARERLAADRRTEILRRIERTRAQLDRLTAEYKAMGGEK